MSIKRLFGKERVAEVMGTLDASGQGSSEPEAGWFDLFSSRYRKGIYFRTIVFHGIGITFLFLKLLLCSLLHMYCIR